MKNNVQKKKYLNMKYYKMLFKEIFLKLFSEDIYESENQQLFTYQTKRFAVII